MFLINICKVNTRRHLACVNFKCNHDPFMASFQYCVEVLPHKIIFFLCTCIAMSQRRGFIMNIQEADLC